MHWHNFLKNKAFFSKKKRIFLAGVVIVIGLGYYVFLNMDVGLEVVDPLPKSLDVLFTLSGEMTRLQYSKELFAKGRVSFWLLSFPNKKIMDTFQKDGLDTARIGIVDSCANTRSEIAFLKQWLMTGPRSRRFLRQENGQDSTKKVNVGIVSNWYHMRRIQLIVETQIRKGLFTSFYLPVPNTYDTYRDRHKSWWRQKTVREIVYSEWKKNIYYLFSHPQLIGYRLVGGKWF
jgi:hypothetical protein